MGTRRFWGALAFSIAMIGLAVAKPEPPNWVLSPSKGVYQGNILEVTVPVTETNLSAKTITLGKLKAPLFLQPDGRYHAVIGVPIDTPAQSLPLTLLDPNNKALEVTTINVLPKVFPKQNIVVSKQTQGLQPLPGELEAIQTLKTVMTATKYWETPFIAPTPGCEISPFGVKRYHNGTYTGDYHKGIDLKSGQGTPIKAIAGGTVKVAAPQFRLHGGTVGLDHGQGLSSVYIHMSKVLVKPGQRVFQGDVIGLVGATGFATGPHLHWGLYANGVPVNPDAWIPVKKCS